MGGMPDPGTNSNALKLIDLQTHKPAVVDKFNVLMYSTMSEKKKKRNMVWPGVSWYQSVLSLQIATKRTPTTYLTPLPLRASLPLQENLSSIQQFLPQSEAVFLSKREIAPPSFPHKTLLEHLSPSRPYAKLTDSFTHSIVLYTLRESKLPVSFKFFHSTMFSFFLRKFVVVIFYLLRTIWQLWRTWL